MCRQYSAESEAALKALVEIEHTDSSDLYKNREWLALHALSQDPYQLEIVRKAIRFYLDKQPLDSKFAEMIKNLSQTEKFRWPSPDR